MSPSEGPFGAVWEEQLDDEQHPHLIFFPSSLLTNSPQERNTIFWLRWRRAVNDTYSHLLFISLQKLYDLFKWDIWMGETPRWVFLNLVLLLWGALSGKGGLPAPRCWGKEASVWSSALVWQKESDFKGSCCLIYVQSWAFTCWCPRGVPGHP